MRNAELMVGREPRHAKLRICNVACYLDKFVFFYNYGLIVKFDCYCGHGVSVPTTENKRFLYRRR